MRARLPDVEGTVDRDGVRLHYEVHGREGPGMLFVPPWSIVHSRVYKAQVPYFSQRFRCVTYDPRGNGRSDRPLDARAYAFDQYVADALAVMDATLDGPAILVGLSSGAPIVCAIAAYHAGRARAAVMVGAAAPIGPSYPYLSPQNFLAQRSTYEGWDKYNRDYWLIDYPSFAEHFMTSMFPEPHSTKQVEDGVGWAAETSAEVLVRTVEGRAIPSSIDAGEAMYRRVGCPALMIHGEEDSIQPPAKARFLAGLTGAELVMLPQVGHNPFARFPAKCNLLIDEFLSRRLGVPAESESDARADASVDADADAGADAASGAGAAADARRRPPVSGPLVSGLPTAPGVQPKKVLFLSSPIGLGHGRRDLAIARELRRLRPGLQIDWLAQDPVTRMLRASGEHIHPLSARLASESQHIESECGEHDLNAFQAIRRMDEILVANFMVFQKAVDEGGYDLVIADEAWDVDHFWHEHPEFKRTTLAWLTDFVGFVPMPAGGEREAFLTRDYNAEMIGHIERHPGVRDRAIFVGSPADIVPLSFGADLPAMRDWIPRHFDFCGYVLGDHPDRFGDRAGLRAALGYRPDERVCLITVGGSGVGTHLIRRVLQAIPEVAPRLPELRTILVAGPRIDPASLQVPAGVEVRAFVPDLDRHLAACDLALVQGGLTTCMELAAARRPFLYFPLKNHFEQNVHVAHRLDRYRAGRRLAFDETTPESIAEAMLAALDSPVDSLPVEADGAARAARMLAEMV